MQEDVSMSIKVGILITMIGTFMMTVIALAVPSVNWVRNRADDSDIIYTTAYRQLKAMQGTELDSGRVYRYLIEADIHVAVVAVRESPVTKPNNYKIIACSTSEAVTPALQQHIDVFNASGVEYQGYEDFHTYFAHDMITKDFRIYVKDTLDGRLEIICDLTDEFYK